MIPVFDRQSSFFGVVSKGEAHQLMKKILFVISLLAAQAQAAMIISEIDLANDRVELVNNCGFVQEISTWWWCNNVNGSPRYSRVSDYAIDSLSTASSYTSINPGEILVINLTAGMLPDANGELGLYAINSFGSAAVIADYVLWGADGNRDFVAENSGIWINNDEIDISGLGVGDTIQLGLGLPGNSAADYSLGAGTLGAANIPEPSVALLSLLGVLGVIHRRR